MERVRLCLIYMKGATQLSAGHTHETYDNRTRNCFSSPKYVRICGRHEELQCSRRTPRRERRLDGNQAQEPFRKYARSDRACFKRININLVSYEPDRPIKKNPASLRGAAWAIFSGNVATLER